MSAVLGGASCRDQSEETKAKKSRTQEDSEQREFCVSQRQLRSAQEKRCYAKRPQPHMYPALPYVCPSAPCAPPCLAEQGSERGCLYMERPKRRMQGVSEDKWRNSGGQKGSSDLRHG